MSELPGNDADSGAPDVPPKPADVVPTADAPPHQVVAWFYGTDFGDLLHALTAYRSSMDRAGAAVGKLETMVSPELRAESDMSPWDYVSMTLADDMATGLFVLNQPSTDRLLARRGFRSMTKALCFAEEFDKAQRLARAINDPSISQMCLLMTAQSLARSGRVGQAFDLVRALGDAVDPQVYVILGAIDAIVNRDPSALDGIVGARDPMHVRQLEATLVRAITDDELRTGSRIDMPQFRYLTTDNVAVLAHWRCCRWNGLTASPELFKTAVYGEPIMSDLRYPLLHEFGVGAGLACNERLTLSVMELALNDDLFVYLRGYQLGLARSLTRIGRLKSAESAQ
jgi:hypothetical protein